MNEQNDTSSGLELERLHTVPTHLTTVDSVLSLGELSLSSRQFLLLLVGGSLSAALWTRTAGLIAWLPPAGLVLHWMLLLLLLLVICLLVFAFGQAQGRSFDSWLVVVIAYLARPRLYLWRSLREHSGENLSFSASSLGAAAATPLLLSGEDRVQEERGNKGEEPIA